MQVSLVFPLKSSPQSRATRASRFNTLQDSIGRVVEESIGDKVLVYKGKARKLFLVNRSKDFCRDRSQDWFFLRKIVIKITDVLFGLLYSSSRQHDHSEWDRIRAGVQVQESMTHMSVLLVVFCNKERPQTQENSIPGSKNVVDDNKRWNRKEKERETWVRFWHFMNHSNSRYTAAKGGF